MSVNLLNPLRTGMYPNAISVKVTVLQQFEQGWFGTMKVVLETAPPLFFNILVNVAKMVYAKD